MASNWTTYKVGDLFDLQNGFAFKGTDFIDDGVPVIKIKNVKAGKILLNDLSYVSREVADKARRFLIQTNDILITMSGNRMDGSPETWVGKVALFQEEGEFLLNQRVGILRPKEGIDVNVDFCAYALSSWEYQNHFIMAANSSGGQANISPLLITETEISLPVRASQDEIASVLRAIDDKIRINEEMNSLSDSIASSIFREWFVNFNFPNTDGNNQVSEIGLIPQGWSIKLLGDLVEIKYGKDHRQIADGTIPVYGSGGVMRYGNKPIYENESILIPRKGTLNNLFYLNKPFWTVDTMFYTIIKNSLHGRYLFLYLKSLNLASMNVGSAVPSMTTEILNNLKILMPPVELLSDFDSLLESIFENIENSSAETKDLIALKNDVLPKLLNQEIEI